MIYALISSDGTIATYPYNLAQLRRDNPDVSFPADMSDEVMLEFGVSKVLAVPQPDYDLATENVVEGTPVLLDGAWSQVWTVEAATAEQIAERQRAAADETAARGVKSDTFVSNFLAMTPAELSTYIDANTATIAAMRGLVKKMALMLLILARREFR